MATEPLWSSADVALVEDDEGVKLKVRRSSSGPLSDKDRWSLALALMDTLPGPEDDD